ncbi:FAD-binding protein [Bacillus sp. B15-48]|uniref:FAD-binding protein n=1 Tax=Bacillus sp. B15-48 TaxID=1548601 RepID=UPI00193FDEBC|nr:FAD-binding protein [Bacillus sp. B15-48]MBM4765028.1 FAD-binding protein [Bacillus sp. B15-48]
MQSGPIVRKAFTDYVDIPWTDDNLDAVKRGWILNGHTLEELAEKINCHPENRRLMTPEILVHSVQTYNVSCDLGVDKEFNRESDSLGRIEKPPFYALPLYAGGPNTKGGIMSNAKRQVLNWREQPIPRLYAAGEISSVFQFAYQGGGNLAECIAFGRVAGKHAALEQSWSS